MPRFPFMAGSTQTLGSTLNTHNSPQASSNIGWTVNNGFRQLLAPIPMVFTEMYFQLGTAPGAGTSRTFRSRKGLSNDNMVFTISNTDTLGSDIVNQTSLTAGQLFDIFNSFSGTPANSSTNRWAFWVQSENQVLTANSGNTVSATNYTGIQSTSGASTTRSYVEQAFPTSGKIRNLYAYLGSGTVTSGSYTVTLYKNGSSTGLSCTLDSTNRLNSDTTDSISVAEGDLLAWETAYNAPSTNRTVLISCEFVPDVPGEGVIMTTNGATAASHTVKNYSPFYSCTNLFGNVDTAGKKAYALPITFTKIYAKLGTAPGSTYVRTFALDNNGSSTPLSVSISGSNTTGSTSVDYTPALGDPINVTSILDNASGASSTIKIGLVFNTLKQSNFLAML